MEPEKVKKIFEDEGIKTSITCIEAFEISEKYSLSKIEIARYCNLNNIKIHACQLGCFK
jgi:hypothetical protein